MSRLDAWQKLLRINESDMPNGLARVFLSLGFAPEIHRRVRKLSAKAKNGKLTAKEAEELDQWIEANDILGLLRAKARRAIKRRAPAA